MDYNKINSEIENVDINAIPPEDEPQRQYYFIKLLRRWMEQKVKYFWLPDECKGF